MPSRGIKQNIIGSLSSNGSWYLSRYCHVNYISKQADFIFHIQIRFLIPDSTNNHIRVGNVNELDTRDILPSGIRYKSAFSFVIDGGSNSSELTSSGTKSSISKELNGN